MRLGFTCRGTLRNLMRSETWLQQFAAFHYKNPSRLHRLHPFKMPKKKTTYRKLTRHFDYQFISPKTTLFDRTANAEFVIRQFFSPKRKEKIQTSKNLT